MISESDRAASVGRARLQQEIDQAVSAVLPELTARWIVQEETGFIDSIKLQVALNAITYTSKVSALAADANPRFLVTQAEMAAHEIKSKLIEMVIPKDTATVAYIEGHLDSGKAITVDYREDGTAVVDSEAIRELLELSGCKELWTHAPRT